MLLYCTEVKANNQHKEIGLLLSVLDDDELQSPVYGGVAGKAALRSSKIISK